MAGLTEPAVPEQTVPRQTAPRQLVRVTLTASGLTDDDVVTAAIARATDVLASDVRWGRRCPTCASTEHGQPLVTVPAGVAVSLSRAGGTLAIAVLAGVEPGAGVGVDIESVADIARRDIDAVLLHPLEVTDAGPRDSSAGRTARARLWVAKEAALKSTGIGLRVDPATVRVTAGGPGDPDTASSYSSDLSDSSASIRFFAAGDGLAGAVAVGGSGGFEVEVEVERA